jgi:hypothetical protein
MRLWSLHPCHLDARGLVALWREALLAQAVLAGRTRGYRHHPQLDRFRASDDPLGTLGNYLEGIRTEALRRGYLFDATRIVRIQRTTRLAVTHGQIAYERDHCLRKLWRRDRKRFMELKAVTAARPHPLFTVRRGGIEKWERQ